MRKTIKSHTGFTLIELMIVIAIIAVLAAIIIPALARARYQSQLGACETNVRNLAMSLELYANDNSGQYPLSTGAYPGGPINNVVPLNSNTNYVRAFPKCPTNNTAYLYHSSNSPNGYSVSQQGTAHQPVIPDIANRPAYDAALGLLTR